MQFDLDFVRSQFPAFKEPALHGQAFFENAGGSYPCAQVVDRLTRFYRTRKVQPYGPYEVSRVAGAEMDEARTRLAAMLNVEPDELSFGPSTTQNSYVLAQAFGEMLSEGDAIIVTNQDHEANSGPWRRLAARGVEIREWRMEPETGALQLEALDAMLDASVKLVCFPHCSNIVAELNPVAEIVERAHQAGAYACVDGVSYAPHGLPDIDAMGADIYLYSAYKTYGPHQGVMTIKRELGERLPNQAHFFNGDVLYKRFTPAGPDHAQIAACAGMADYAEALARRHGGPDGGGRETASFVHDLMRAQEVSLARPLLDYLSTKNSVRLIGPQDAEARAPTIAMALQRPAGEVAAELAEKNIMTSGGSFYAQRCLEGLDLDPAHGVLRTSFVHYTAPEEISALIAALDDVL